MAGCAAPNKQPLEVSGHWTNSDKTHLELIPASESEGELRVYSPLGEPVYKNKITYRVRENMSEGRNYHLHLEGVPQSEPANKKVIVIGVERTFSYGAHHYTKIDTEGFKTSVRSEFSTFVKGVFHGKNPATEVTAHKLSGIDILFNGIDDIEWQVSEPNLKPIGFLKTPVSPTDTAGILTLSSVNGIRNVKCVITKRFLDQESIMTLILFKKGHIGEIRKIETDKQKNLILSTANGNWECSTEENGAQTPVTTGDLVSLAAEHNLRFLSPGHKELIDTRIYNVQTPKPFFD